MASKDTSQNFVNLNLPVGTIIDAEHQVRTEPATEDLAMTGIIMKHSTMIEQPDIYKI